jgi:putative ABC transport system ATP-binding protein
MEPLISIRGVNHYFGTGSLRKQILFDVSAEIQPGEIVINTGPSGSGKTTLLTLAGALRSVQEGSLLTLGQELNNASAQTLANVRKNIGFIFQAHNLLASLTACQNVEMALGVEREADAPADKKGARERAIEMLESVGLGERIHHLPRQLSGGQKQRVAIARALVSKPKIILADEPTAALDKKSGREVVEILHNLAKKNGCAILLVTHDNRILDIADRIMTLEDGRISSFTSGVTANAGQLLGGLTQMQRKGELVRHVSSLSDRKFVEFLEQATSEFERFLRTVEVGSREAIGALGDQVLEAAAVRIRDMLGADRATLYIYDAAAGELRSRIAHTDGGGPLEIRISAQSGIAGHVALTGETLNIPDAYKSPYFNPELDKETGYRTRTILCMPIYDRRKQVFAVAQLLNKKDGQSFTSADEQKFREFAGQLGVLLESCVNLGKESELPVS